MWFPQESPEELRQVPSQEVSQESFQELTPGASQELPAWATQESQQDERDWSDGKD